jgi:mRNA-degrading endonuclease toxin of MazEF toxin-antitoxin module
MIAAGEIYIADLLEAGPHPVIVVSREDLNRGRYALGVVCTSAEVMAHLAAGRVAPARALEEGKPGRKAGR